MFVICFLKDDGGQGVLGEVPGSAGFISEDNGMFLGQKKDVIAEGGGQ